MRGLACVDDCLCQYMHAHHKQVASLVFCSTFCHLILFSAGLVAALVSFNVRVHTTLKQLVRERQTLTEFPQWECLCL